MYKKCVMFFRSLYSFTRLLPAFRLFKRLKTELALFQQNQQPSPIQGGVGLGGVGGGAPLKIGYRLSTSRFMPLDEAGLGEFLLWV
jgi:hypothetical protein